MGSSAAGPSSSKGERERKEDWTIGVEWRVGKRAQWRGTGGWGLMEVCPVDGERSQECIVNVGGEGFIIGMYKDVEARMGAWVNVRGSPGLDTCRKLKRVRLVKACSGNRGQVVELCMPHDVNTGEAILLLKGITLVPPPGWSLTGRSGVDLSKLLVICDRMP